MVFPTYEKVSAADETADVDQKSTSSSKDASRRTWLSNKTIRNREFGASNCRSPDWFRYKALGSLHIVQRFKLTSELVNHNSVNCLHFNASGTCLASGNNLTIDSDLDVCLWDWAIKKPVSTFASGHRGEVLQAKFMPLSDDRRVVTCAVDGEVRLAELTVQGVCTRKLTHHRGEAYQLALELDSPHMFLTCGEDGVVYEIDLRDPKPNKLLDFKKSTSRDDCTVPLYSIHSHPVSSHYFAVCGGDQYVRIFEKRRLSGATDALKKFCPEVLINVSSCCITHLIFNHDGSELLASYNNKDLYIFEVKSNSENSDKVLHSYTGNLKNETVKCVNFYGPNSEYVIGGSDSGHIYFWDKNTAKVVKNLCGVNVLDYHPTAAILATSGLDLDIKIWTPLGENDAAYCVHAIEKNSIDNTFIESFQ